MGDAVRARVHVTLKAGVLDPQGEAVLRALESLGFSDVGSVRISKVIELELDDTDEGQAMTVSKRCVKSYSPYRYRRLQD